MIEFPAATVVHRKLSKESFYKHLTLTPALKEKFVSDVDRIFVENSLSKKSLNLQNDAEISEILLLSLSLKKRECDSKILEAIAKQNPHKLVFLLTFEGESQLALYRKKLYRTEWVEDSAITIKISGFTLDEIWASLVEQVALKDEPTRPAAELSLDERLARQDKIRKLEKQIAKTEKATWKEQQPKKRFELHQELLRLRSELEAL